MSIRECAGCRTKVDLPDEDFPLCENCRDWEKKHHEEIMYRKCTLCGYRGAAIDEHHIHGKSISNETIVVCCNCHRELHAGVKTL